MDREESPSKKRKGRTTAKVAASAPAAESAKKLTALKNSAADTVPFMKWYKSTFKMCSPTIPRLNLEVLMKCHPVFKNEISDAMGADPSLKDKFISPDQMKCFKMFV